MVAKSPSPQGLCITIDVEEHASPAEGYRFDAALSPLIEGLDATGVSATFFIVGSLAPAWSDRIRQLVGHGHEIGLHGYTHQFLADLGPKDFEAELRKGRDVIGDIVGEPPVGFRAPYFSLTASCTWAPDLLVDAGFTYSSSVLPASNPQAGFVGAPRRPFLWPNGLIEFPSPVFGLGRVSLPVLGGAYLRLAPSWVVRLAARRERAVTGSWTYSHPYDFDVDEPFVRRGDQSWLFARLLFARRRLMHDRVLALAGPASSTLGVLASNPDFRAGLDVFTPERT